MTTSHVLVMSSQAPLAVTASQTFAGFSTVTVLRGTCQALCRVPLCGYMPDVSSHGCVEIMVLGKTITEVKCRSHPLVPRMRPST